ncbi:MAG: mannose-6-phosphate isomerase [Muribaculaceae bacterium]|nr:mannose-6-phosphate isomerase [Muribaculaceae bacterium]
MHKIRKAPIRFSPYFKRVIWGGDRIFHYKNMKPLDEPIGESWEISAIPGCESVAADGEYAGKTLSELVELFHEDLLGRKAVERYGKKFPLLIKFIDANDNLSVQVHPDDTLAMKRHGSLGKTEMWYIISAEENAGIVAGFNRKLSPEEYRERVKNNTLLETLAVHESAPGKVFFLPAGQVHAIGGGNLLAEIQESSDITYRIYDYDRRDASGKPRELHCEMAEGAIDFTPFKEKTSPHPVLPGVTRIVDCDHFKTHIIDVEKPMEYDAGYESFTVLVCVEGEVDVTTEEGVAKLTAGHSILLPAVVTEFILKGRGKLLAVNV